MNSHNYTPYNSAALRQTFPHVYQDFFSANPTIVSSPGVFGWAGSGYYALYFGSPLVFQTLPLRTFIGIQERSDSRVVFQSSRQFIPRDHVFVPCVLTDPVKSRLENFLTISLRTINPSTTTGVDIHELTEFTVGSGLSASSSFSMGVACALYLHAKRIGPETLADWGQLKASELRHDELFDEVFRFAWKIDSIMQGSVGSGSCVYISAVGGSSPVVYYLSDTPWRSSADGIQFSPNDPSYVDQCTYGAFHVSELSQHPHSFTIPFDVSLIQTGIPLVRSVSPLTIDNAHTLIEKNLAFYQKDILPLMNERDGKGFTDSPLTTNLVWSSFNTMVTTITIDIIKYLARCNGDYAPMDQVSALFRGMNDYERVVKVFSDDTSYSDLLIRFLHNETRKISHTHVGLGIVPSSTSVGGYLLMTSPMHIREEIPGLIELFNERYGGRSPVTVDWMSARDGYESRGIVLEQSLAHGQYSDGMTSGTVQVRHVHRDGSFVELYTKEEFERKKHEMDVLLDPVLGEIRVRGEKLTSKDLRTTSQTLQLFQYLVSSPDQAVSRSSFPDSGYTRDRNEFQSKIISPLVKAIESRTNQKLDVKIHGGIIDYDVHFTPNHVHVYLVEQSF